LGRLRRWGKATPIAEPIAMASRPLSVLLIAAALGACGTQPDDRAGSGAAVGAGSGAAVGALFFGVGAIPGALIGAGVGAGTGAATAPPEATGDRPAGAPAVAPMPTRSEPPAPPEAAAPVVVASAPPPVAREPTRIARPAGDREEPVRPATVASAVAPAATPAPATPEAAPPVVTEDDVRVVQETLQAQGLYLGPLDGTLGSETRHALAEYQRRAGLRATATLDPETMRRLDADQSDSGYGGSR
jgi:hypothetical protein